MPSRLSTRISTGHRIIVHSPLLHRVRTRGNEIEITVRHRNQLVRCVVVGTVLIQRLRVRESSSPRRVVRAKRSTSEDQPRVRYRFTCTVCKNVCGTKHKHASNCPSCKDHDVPPVNGEVKSTGVCTACAEKWRHANRGKEICVTCNREIV